MTSRPRQSDGRVHGVVVACRRDDGRWLCIRRSQHVAAPLKVCFPGGAMEVGEPQEVAAIREMQEELGITVRPIRCVWRWDSPTTDLTLWGWIAELPHHDFRDFRLDPTEVAEILWLAPHEATEHPDAMPSNQSFVSCLLREIALEPESDQESESR
jgi:8-oxo-dGTP diphosphatase